MSPAPFDTSQENRTHEKVPPEHVTQHRSDALLQQAGHTLLVVMTMAIASGTACALFLWLLDVVTKIRYQHPGIVWLLPVAGLASGWMYDRFGSTVEAGNNLILNEIGRTEGRQEKIVADKPHDDQAAAGTSGVPFRMGPLVLVGTLITHLFGGSAGREGTAVQMSGSLASFFGRWRFRGHVVNAKSLLTAGIAAGFAGVFGTPSAGVAFAFEVLVAGKLSIYRQATEIPSLTRANRVRLMLAFGLSVLAAIVSDKVCTLWGIGHTHYSIQSNLIGNLVATPGTRTEVDSYPFLQFVLLAAIAGLVFAGGSRLFCMALHQIASASVRLVKRPWLRPAIGGAIVLSLAMLLGTFDYLGLGVDSPDPSDVTIVSCFRADGANSLSWLWKMTFTAITVGCSFKGGEVTPLFFIGAALGNMLAIQFALPIDLFAGLGFVAVFAAATKTPLACTIMAIELFGSEYGIFYLISCYAAFLASGSTSIYRAQKSLPGRSFVA